MQKLRPIMFVGTGSDVGKSVINTGFCRIFLQDGYAPAPFKAQNMSLNSYPTKDHLEIGRAQAVQAEACGIDCRVEMNPVLLKPTDHCISQVVLNGKPAGNKSAYDFFNKTDRNALFAEVMKSYRRLASIYNPMVIEGAGSISEINLWEKDIVNMRVALETGAAAFLVADIDKGGVFASVYGTVMLLPTVECNAVKGIIINKFRGDIGLFEEGKKKLEALTCKPVVGVIPYFTDVFIEQEDGVMLEKELSGFSPSEINIGVVLLKHLSNFTDFNMLEQVSGVNLYYTDIPDELAKADIIILPGSKNTLSDLKMLRINGLAKVILKHHRDGKPVFGICGGYQMMGMKISDPEGVEGDIAWLPGLGILPVTTVLTRNKQMRQVGFTFIDESCTGEGYEIHAGYTDSDHPLCRLNNGESDGYYLNDFAWGTYIHGIFDNRSVIDHVLQKVKPGLHSEVDYKARKEAAYDRLAQIIRDHMDMEYIYQSMQL